MLKKKIVLPIVALAIIIFMMIVVVVTGNKGNIDRVDHVIGYSALYDEELIKEAIRVVEKEFAKDFEGCSLTELRYDEDVENKFAEEIMEYNTENNRELIILLSTFDTDEKGGDGSFSPNDTYTNWQWHLVRTEEKKSWEIITCGY